MRRDQVSAIRGIRRDWTAPLAAVIALMLAIALAWSPAQTASAQVDSVSCGHFQTQADAQEVLEFGNLDENGRQSLDRDGDGIACEEAFGLDPDSPPPARDYVSCGHFETQEDAQELLESGLLDENGRQSLDGDGNGIACEHTFGTSGESAPVALPKTGSGLSASDVASSWLGLATGMSLGSIGAALIVRRQAMGRGR
jgi:hypothetical protein